MSTLFAREKEVTFNPRARAILMVEDHMRLPGGEPPIELSDEVRDAITSVYSCAKETHYLDDEFFTVLMDRLGMWSANPPVERAVMYALYLLLEDVLQE